MGKRKRGNEEFDSKLGEVFLFGGEARAEKAAKDLASNLKLTRRINDILRKEVSKQGKFVPEVASELDQALHEVEILLHEAERILYQDVRKIASDFKKSTN
ncbi:hypothetical protein Poli38472_003172 [Pythium oligandrum]|uniref:Uncharacterized protein n=1 Tax=Pythium oligandrum TaxID=41045 RepID=A0A8K1C654_PYTOL|nr:hypothetical protein Poli38472_003172 [Pythium oligandrum]|eukprot:TMW57247.1 hypothetical protein Poli38472_003172 [Pythium oligandrum]